MTWFYPAGLDINLFWDLPCRTSEGNFHLSEMKIHLPKPFWLVLIDGILCFWNCFGIEGGSNFNCPLGQVGWEVQLSNSYFQLSRAVGQSLMSIPAQTQNVTDAFLDKHFRGCMTNNKHPHPINITFVYWFYSTQRLYFLYIFNIWSIFNIGFKVLNNNELVSQYLYYCILLIL